MSEAEKTREKRPRDPDLWARPVRKYRKGKGMMEYRPDAEFFALADPVVLPERTLLGYDRLYVFWQAIRNLAGVPGSAVEVGTYRGGSALFIAGAFRALHGTDVRLDVFDTFEGHPAAALSDQDTYHREQTGLFQKTTYDDVKDYLSPFPDVHVHAGDVLVTLPDLPERPYSLVHVDTDLYLPTKACLDYFGPRLSPGGVIVVDDYSSPNCPGVRDAAVEYLAGRHGYHVWDQRTKQLVLIKR
jgi:O-methyltransferase